MKHDPLEILIAPHAVIEWMSTRGLLMERHFTPELAAKRKAEREKGKYAVFHDKLRLYGLFDSREEAQTRIEEIVGNKRKCWENKRIYTVKECAATSEPND